MHFPEIIDTLVKFKYVDKYEAFHKLQPGIIHTNEAEKQVVAEILDSCCTALIGLLENSPRLLKTALKKSLVQCMDDLSHADILPDNREFAYQLGWYLAEKVEVDLRKVSARKIWGYWTVEADEVKIVKPPVRKKKKSAPAKEIRLSNANGG